MNRLHHLKQTLPLNIRDNTDFGNLEFVLLDYNSSDGLESYVRLELHEYIKSGKLVYYRTEEPRHYNMSHSRNMVFKLATGDILCNLDADNFTGEGFAYFINSTFQDNEQIFLSTHETSFAKNDVLGRICVMKKHFLAVNGYDERMKHYGFDDYDFANRLKQLGLKCLPIGNHSFLRAIGHTDKERMNNGLDSGGIEHLLIRYINPAATELVILFTNKNYKKATIVNNYIFNLLSPPLRPRRSIKFAYSIMEEQWETGHWDASGDRLHLRMNRINHVFHKSGPHMYTQGNNRKFYSVISPKVQEEVLFFFNQSANRIIMEENLTKKTVRVNNDGFGKGQVSRCLIDK